jgi:thioredoxin reductase
MYDVIVVGGGPAGLSAALVLGRCRRKVLVVDDGRPRNSVSHGVHGFLTRDGLPPAALRRIGREQLAPYDVELVDATVVRARRTRRGFRVALQDSSRRDARMLVLATGVADHVPDVPGIRECYGRSVFHCPYCDGWEVRDRPLAAYAFGPTAAEFALGLTSWSADVVLFTDGHRAPDGRDRRRLTAAGIPVRRQRIARLESRRGALSRVVLATGEAIPRRALFFHAGVRQRSRLAERLGCRFSAEGWVETETMQRTHEPGLYVIGDASRNVQFAIVAAAEGAVAGYDVHRALRKAAMPSR